MKLCLVNPPVWACALAGETKSMKRVINVIPSLGLGYIAAVLLENSFDVKIFDCSLGTTHSELIELLKKERPNIVGITGTTPAFANMKKVAEDVRRSLPSTLVVVGGSHITAAPEYTMGFDCFDVGVIGEGEITFLELVKKVEHYGLCVLSDIKGIIYRKDGGLVKTEARPPIRDLDSLPFPARQLQPPLGAYRPTPASYRELPLGVLMTSRGCPSKCTFCDRAVFGSTFRQRSADNVLDEIEELIGKFGARELRFFDDTFTLNKERVFEICDKFKERKIKIPWTCLTKVTNISEGMLKKMKQAGCWQVLFGLESGDERMLKLLKKGNTIEQNERAVRLAKQAGLSTRADFIVGTPGETLESLKRTLNFAIRLGVDYAHFNKFVPFPGTELYEMLTRQGYKFDFTKNFSILDHSAIFYVPQSMTRGEFKQFLDYANRRFYLRPSYILKRLFSISSLTELKGQINGFLAIYNLK